MHLYAIKAVLFALGLTFSQAKAVCPNHKLLRVYNDHSDYYACDTKDGAVVLAFSNADKGITKESRLVGIFDLKWFLSKVD